MNDKAVKRKLKSRCGESLAETLIALLIAAVALTMLASMISTSTKLIENSKNLINSFVREDNRMVMAAEDSQNSSGGVYFVMQGELGEDNIRLAADEVYTGDSCVEVYYFINQNAAQNNSVVSYRPSTETLEEGSMDG